MQSGGICVICKLGFVGVRLRICWICVFGFLSGRRTVCGENDGRIGVCRSPQVDCTALISSVCPCVHEERSEYFSGEGWTLKIEDWTSKTQDDGDEDDVDNGTDEKTFYGFAVGYPLTISFFGQNRREAIEANWVAMANCIWCFLEIGPLVLSIEKPLVLAPYYVTVIITIVILITTTIILLFVIIFIKNIIN